MSLKRLLKEFKEIETDPLTFDASAESPIKI